MASVYMLESLLPTTTHCCLAMDEVVEVQDSYSRISICAKAFVRVYMRLFQEFARRPDLFGEGGLHCFLVNESCRSIDTYTQTDEAINVWKTLLRKVFTSSPSNGSLTGFGAMK